MDKKIPFKELFYYGLPSFSIALLGLPLYIYMPTFYTQNVGLDIMLVGTVLFLARLLDVFFDPFIGFLSDRYFNPKKMMLFSVVLLLIGFYFLVNPIVSGGYFWLFFFSLMVYFSWSALIIPYYSIGSNLGETHNQNTHYAMSREFFTMFGVLFALAIPYIFGISNEPKKVLYLMFLTILFLLPISALIFFTKVKDVNYKPQLASFLGVTKMLFSEVSNLKNIFLTFFLNNLANALPATLFLFYVNLVLKSPDLTGLLLLLYFFSGIIALPFWAYVSSIAGKRKAWIYSMASASFFFSFVPFLNEGDVVLFALITIFSGFSLGADIALPASMQADISQDRCKNSENMSGMLFGFFAMLTKLSLAFGVGISFGILGFFDFDSANPTAQSLFVLSLLYGFAPLILKIFAIYTLLRHKEPQTQDTI